MLETKQKLAATWTVFIKEKWQNLGRNSKLCGFFSFS
jgi:hypothetical protein